MQWFLDLMGKWDALVVGLVLGIVFGIFLRRATRRILVWCSATKAGSPLAKAVRWLGAPACWLHYSENANAVVEREIADCRDYLRMHFADGEPGEIWLYNSDLNGFLDEDDFNKLYRDTIADNKLITKVRIVLKRDVLEDMVSSVDKWRTIDDNLRITRAEGRPPALESLLPRLVYCFTDDFPARQEEILKDRAFKAYTSDEGFVFYTRGHRLTSPEAVCVHRRLSEDGSEKYDLRITVTASREKRDGDGFHKFMPEDWRRKFQYVFEPGDHWKPFAELVKEKLAP